jgi:hypothetical protein
MMDRTRRLRRLIAGGAAGLVGLTMLAGPSGAAISTQAFCAAVPQGQSGFSDIAQAGVHARNVECLKGSGVTSGTTATTYSPVLIVNRGQMSTFIANMIDRANALDAPAAPNIPDLPTAEASQDRFRDDEGNTHENNINRLAEAGIVNGTTATTFSPTADVSRGQMASFVAQALSFVRGGALPEGADAFTDDETSIHEANINRLANADIVDGTSATTFAPGNLVSRAQMGSFIIQAMADLAADGFITNLPGGSNATLPVTPSDTVTLLDADAEANPDATAGDNRSYTATGLTAGQAYRITLVQCSLVTNTNGQFSFQDNDGDANASEPEDSDGLATAGVVGARIVTVNGAAYAPVAPETTQSAPAVQPVNGAITFVIDATGVGCATPVIYTDQGGANTRLNIDAQGRPTEPFGVGGSVNTGPPEAAIGNQGGNVTVATVDPAGDSFTSTTASYFYDAGDTFQFQGAGITLAQFEGILSAGDILAISYNPDPAGGSSFNVTTDINGAVPTVSAAVSNRDADPGPNDVTVTITPKAGTPTGTTFQVQRATVNQVGATCGDGDDIVGAFANVGAPQTATTLNDDDRPAGCYVYRASATDPLTTSTSGFSGPSNAAVVA